MAQDIFTRTLEQKSGCLWRWFCGGAVTAAVAGLLLTATCPATVAAERPSADYAFHYDRLLDHVAWICHGDTSAAVSRDTGGLTNIGYIGGGQPYQAESVLQGDVLKVKLGDDLHHFKNVTHYPFGVVSRWNGTEVTFAVNDYAVMIEVRNPQRQNASFLLDDTCLNREKNMFWETLPFDAAHQALRFYFAAIRNEHRLDPNPARDDVTDPLDLRLMPDQLKSGQVYVMAGLACAGKRRALHNVHVFSTDAEQGTFVIAFGATNAECRDHFLGLRGRSIFAEQKAHYDGVYAKAPKVHIRHYPALSEMVNVLPVYYECLKIWDKDGRGTIRGTNNVDGWVEGGWDQLLGSFGLLWTKDYEYVKKIIRFHVDTARPDGKVTHMHDLDRSPHTRQDRYDLTDYLMLSLVARYFDFVRDEPFLKEVAPFVTRLFASIMATSDQQTGFVACEGLYPDFPWNVAGRPRIAYPCMEQTSLYAACCATEKLAKKLGDPALAESARAMTEKIRAHFSRYFFDNEKGYLYESVSLDGYQPNPCYAKYSIYGIGLPGGESLFDAPQLRRMADFALKNFFEGDNLRTIPLWDKGAKLAPHGTDVGVWTTLSYPTEDRSLYKLFKCAGNAEGVKRMLSRMERIFATLKVVPELVPTSQAEFQEDLYSTVRTRWLPLSMGPWHCLVVEGLLGFDAENGEIKIPRLDSGRG